MGNDSVICCVLLLDGKVVFVRQARPNLGLETLELPAGQLESTESPYHAAKREFLEETGMTCEFLYLGDFSLMMNRTTIKEHIFFGVDPARVSDHLVEEDISVELLERSQVLPKALSGEYRQLAGLGVFQLISGRLGLDVLRDPLPDIINRFYEEKEKDEG